MRTAQALAAGGCASVSMLAPPAARPQRLRTPTRAASNDPAPLQQRAERPAAGPPAAARGLWRPRAHAQLEAGSTAEAECAQAQVRAPGFGGSRASPSRCQPPHAADHLTTAAAPPSRAQDTAAAAAAAPPAAPPPDLEPGEPARPGLTTRLKGWMPWSQQQQQQQQAIPLASTLGRPSPASSFADEDAALGDGMAAAAPPGAAPPPRGSWHALGRRRGAASGQLEAAARRRQAAADEAAAERPVATDHAALRLLRERVISGSAPGQRGDAFKLGLVVEGGGMRGCVSGGALQALSDLGVRGAFDAVYGSSAGAINGTYFLSGQRDGVAIYHDHIASQEFIDIRRLLSRRPGLPPALNLDFLLGHVMETVLPLDFDAVLASPIPLKVVASSLDALAPVLLQGFACRDDLRACLRASATVPEVAGGPVVHRGQALVDAAVFEPVPFRSAIADGCTHLLVLCTRPRPARRSYLDRALADALEAGVKRAVMSPAYMVPAWRAEVDSLVRDGLGQDEMLARAFDPGAAELPWFGGAHVYPVYPSARATSFSPLCIDVPTLKGGVAEGRRATLQMLRATLGDYLDFGPHEAAANIVPLAPPGQRGSGDRLWRRYIAGGDFSSHA
jgi:predicted patatin/cPLA2 family phospholipase